MLINMQQNYIKLLKINDLVGKESLLLH